MFWVKSGDWVGSIIRHQNQLRRRDIVPYSDQVTQPSSQHRVRGGTSNSCNTSCDSTRDAAAFDVFLGVMTGSAIGAITFTTSAEGQPSCDAGDPCCSLADLPYANGTGKPEG